MFDKAPKGLENLQYTKEKAKKSKKKAIKRSKRSSRWQDRKLGIKNKY